MCFRFRHGIRSTNLEKKSITETRENYQNLQAQIEDFVEVSTIRIISEQSIYKVQFFTKNKKTKKKIEI